MGFFQRITNPAGSRRKQAAAAAELAAQQAALAKKQEELNRQLIEEERKTRAAAEAERKREMNRAANDLATSMRETKSQDVEMEILRRGGYSGYR